MRNFAIALAALMVSATGAVAAPAFGSVPGSVFVRADVNNDGVLNAAEQKRAEKILYLRELQGGND
ncbi:MAG: hypothetical protein AAF909_01225 [Pseudomonadota bacterium]